MYTVHCDQPWTDSGTGVPQCPGTLLLDAAPWWELSIADGQQLLTQCALILLTAWGAIQIIRVIKS